MMRSRFAYRVTALLLALALLLPGFAAAQDYPFTGFLTQDTALRSSPSDSASSLRSLPAGEAVLITGASGNFYIAAYLGQQGYLPQRCVSTVKSGGVAAVSPSEAANTQSNLYGLLYSGMSGDAVSALQDALTELGFYSGPVDGQFGSGTQKAVKAFQQKNGLTQTGTADGAMQELLYSGKPKNSAGKAVTLKTVPPLASAIISSGSIGFQVEKLQARLKELGYYSSTVDGKCGSGTVSAIKAFQKKMGLSQTGKADAALRILLYGSTALSAKATATPRPTATPKPSASASTVAQQPAAYPYTTYTTSSVNLRKSASTSSTRLGTVSKGAAIEVLSSDGTFLRVNALGKTGYVMAEYVNIPVQYLPGTVLKTDAEAQRKYTTLQFGAVGPKVKALRQALQELGFLSTAAGDTFDTNTAAALKNFQGKNGLREDGIASPEVQKLIYEGKPKNSKNVKTDVKTLPPIEGIDMRLNDKGDAVESLQLQLKALGFYSGSISGEFTGATEKAVKAFQKAHGLTTDGVAGSKTMALLTALTASSAAAQTAQAAQPTVQPTGVTAANVVVMREGTRGLAVTNLQQRLIELQYLDDKADGVVGKNTIAAVKAFQKKNGLTADGIAGLATQQRLYSDSAIPAVTASASVSTAATLPYAASPDLKATLKVGSSGDQVRMLQERLSVLNYYTTAIDSVYGTGTAQAVTLFQKSNGLTADGVAGPKTLTKLHSASALPYTQAQAMPASPVSETPVSASVLRSGDSGDQVKNMQSRLVALGYLTAADGIFGPKTFQAVKTFQQRNGLTSDGIAGKMTLTRLNSAAAVAAFGTSAATYDQPAEQTTVGFKAPAAKDVIVADWYNVIRDKVRKQPDVVIYDPVSGLHYNLHMFSFGKHADAEPPTAADTAIMNKVVGTNDWSPKFVWVILSDGTVYLGSTHSHGHEVDHTSGNDLTGHVCVHFPRSMSDAEATGPYAVSHQKEINFGKEMLNAMLGK